MISFSPSESGRLLAMGARGCLTKPSILTDLGPTVEDTLAGETGSSTLAL